MEPKKGEVKIGILNDIKNLFELFPQNGSLTWLPVDYEVLYQDPPYVDKTNEDRIGFKLVL